MTALASAPSIGHHESSASPRRQSAVSPPWLWITGLGFILGAVLVNVPYSMLISSFRYPDILREPTGEILASFAAGGNGLVLTWLAFAWSGIPLLIGLLLLRRILEEDGHGLAGPATTIGVFGAVVQMIGLLRWVFVVPGLAAAYGTSAANGPTRLAIETIFDAVHQYGGVLLGEHLGQVFTIAWMILVSAMMFRSDIFRPWLGWVGFAAAAVYGLAQLELVATVIPDFPTWEPAGLVGSLLWLAWCFLLGVRLVSRSRRGPLHEESGPNRPATPAPRRAGTGRQGMQLPST